MQKNLNYFKINYILFTAAILSAFILYHPMSLLILSAIGAAWTYMYLIRTEPLKIGERPVTDREKMLGMSGVSLLAVFFMSNAGSVIFSAMAGPTLVSMHSHAPTTVGITSRLYSARLISHHHRCLLNPRIVYNITTRTIHTHTSVVCFF